jgi:2-oxo-4-hydroxy-4-carboxy-5-ureidoimidazoline decarboxylase
MTIRALNELDPASLSQLLHTCCGSKAWVEKMLTHFPVADKPALLAAAAQTWHTCTPADGLEAFSHHPRIGAKTPDATATAEQSGTRNAPATVLETLARGNKTYEEKFGYIYIVCATGRSAAEMLELLEIRLGNTPEKEIRIAMGEQEKITRLRLEKLLT